MQQRKALTITDLETAVSIFRSDTFRVDHPFRMTRKLFGPTVLDLEGPEHNLRKRAWVRLFAKAAIDTRLGDIVARAVDAGFRHAHDVGDLAVLCEWIPNRIILDLLGRHDLDPLDHYWTIRRAAEALEHNMLGNAADEMKAYLHSAGFHASDVFRDVPPEVRAGEIAALLVAGVETTIVALKILLRAWARPDGGFSHLVEELGPEAAALRILADDPPLGMAMRFTREPVSIGMETCPAGTIVQVDLANLDGKAGERGHLLFGRGRHQCPGRLLAMLELRSVVQRLASLSPHTYEISMENNIPRAETFRHPGKMVARCPRHGEIGHHESRLRENRHHERPVDA